MFTLATELWARACGDIGTWLVRPPSAELERKCRCDICRRYRKLLAASPVRIP